jgi:dihydrofolate synthase/folylpolyglutamate synthase
VLLDAAHNPHGIEATVAAVQENFNFAPLIGVVAAMADKDVERILELLDPVLAHIVCTQNSTPRSMSATELGELADGIFGADRVIVTPRLDDALERAIALAETAEGYEEALGSGGVLVTGSVVTVGEARVLLGGEPQ